MLKRKLCEASFKWKLECKGPLLIKDERWFRFLGTSNYSKKEGYPDCIFMSRLTQEEINNKVSACKHDPPKLPYFVPGTSIRGPFRARAEMIIRSLVPETADGRMAACDPFEQENETTKSCSKLLEELPRNMTPYSRACPACKIFGCAGLASRISFSDADVEEGYSSAYRDMVGIDRFTGGAYKGAGEDGSGALMRFHVLEGSSFTTTVRLVNFELWHLGLLAYVFRDFREGLVPIGFGKTKGFGMVQGEIEKISLTYPDSTDKVEDLFSLATEEERSVYNLFDHKVEIKPGLKEESKEFTLYKTYSVNDLDEFWKKTASAFNAYMTHLKEKQAETGAVTAGGNGG